jgi:hypothetical protein
MVVALGPTSDTRSQSDCIYFTCFHNNLLYNGYRGPFPEGKARPGRDAGHSPPSSAEVVNE